MTSKLEAATKRATLWKACAKKWFIRAQPAARCDFCRTPFGKHSYESVPAGPYRRVNLCLSCWKAWRSEPPPLRGMSIGEASVYARKVGVTVDKDRLAALLKSVEPPAIYCAHCKAVVLGDTCEACGCHERQ
jgi:hypothetical protein